MCRRAFPPVDRIGVRLNNEKPIVYVLDDDTAVRDSLEALFTSVGLETRTYSSPEALLRKLTPSARGCLVLDMRLPSMGGLILQELLAKRGIQLPILVLTGHADVPSAVRAMRQGAVDFIEKPYNEQVLLDRVHDCIEMDIRRERKISIQSDLNRHLATLTGREREVLDAVVRGESSKVIAKALCISPKTVDVHRSRILEKLHARSTADLVRIVFETYNNKAPD